jgi:chemosensory pili system protein ChpA (sensor histidine kinase/response regulator)
VAQPNRQWELAAAAEAARLRAEQEAAARAAADRAAHERQRETAFLNLVAQARECRTQRNPVRAVSFYESAFAMRRTSELERELAAARAEVEAAKQQALVAERRRLSEAEAARQAAAVAAARAELEKQKAAQFAAEQARRAAEAEQLAAQIARLRDRAARQQASGQWDAALASLQSARRLQPSKELDAQIDAVQTSLAQAAAAQKGAEERERLAKRLAAEKAAREQAERTAAELRQRYDALVKQAETDLAGDRPEAALAGFRNAKKLLAGPEAETGESRAAARLAARRNQANVEAARERQRARLAKLKQTAEQKLKAGDVNAAHAAATEAAKLAPQEPDAQAMTLAVQKAKAESMKQAVAKQQSDARQADFERLLSAGKASLSAKQFSPAVASLTAAAAIDPRHRETQTLLAQAKQGMQSSAKNAEEEKRLAQFRAKLMQGQAALKAKNSKAAAEIFADAQKLYPQDAGVARLLAEAKSAQAAMDKDAERIKQFNQYFAAAQTALSASKLKEAKAAADKAVALAPNYAPAKKLAADVQQALAAADAKAKKSEPPPKKAPPKPAVKSGKPK